MIKSFLVNLFFKKPGRARSDNDSHGTAEGSALFRYLASREKDAAVRGGDRLARHFLGPGLRLSGLCSPVARRLGEYANPGAYHYVNARTRHIDRLLREALQEGLDQVVLLGAGYDTRPVRFSEELRHSRVYEVDFPGTQARKRALLARANLAVPPNLTFVPLDFNTSSLEQALPSAGFQKGARTFFIWEGVSFYLTPAAVDRVLRFVSGTSASGSSIVFDYVLDSFVRGENLSRRAAKSAACHRRLGEPYVLGLPDEGLTDFLAGRGLFPISQLGPPELNRTYLRRSNGRPRGRVFDYIHIVQAGVASGSSHEPA